MPPITDPNVPVPTPDGKVILYQIDPCEDQTKIRQSDVSILLYGPARIRWRQGEAYQDYGVYAYNMQLFNQVHTVQTLGLPLDTSKPTPDGRPLLIEYRVQDPNNATQLIATQRQVTVVNPCRAPEILCPKACPVGMSADDCRRITQAPNNMVCSLNGQCYGSAVRAATAKEFNEVGLASS